MIVLDGLDGLGALGLGRLTFSSSNPSGIGENWIPAAAAIDGWTRMSLWTRRLCARVGDDGSFGLDDLDLS